MKSKTKVVSIILLFSAFMMFVSCGQKQDKIEKIMEDGVEVVLNHIEPYKIKDKPSILNLEKEFSIDLARNDIGELGLAGVTTFDVDSEGNIYLVTSRSKENCIFKFDASGNYIFSFGRKGQGPGEIQGFWKFGIDSKDNIIVSDRRNRKVLIFDKEGNPVKEVNYNPYIFGIFPLENGKYIGEWRIIDSSKDYFLMGFSLYSDELKEMKKMDVYQFPNPLKKGRRGVPSNPVFDWKISNGRIYTGNEDRGYEILQYDLEGNLLRKIRKEYSPVEVPEELKKELKDFYESVNTKVWFPKYMVPFDSFFSDDEGRLLVKTFEKGRNPEEYMYDIFNPEGIFIVRKSLKIHFWEGVEIYAKARRNLLYCLQEKESGYRELVVYKMNWE